MTQEIEPGLFITHDRKFFEFIPEQAKDPSYRQKHPEDCFSPWANSWAIKYKENRLCEMKPTGGIMLLDYQSICEKKSITPNPFIGEIISETPSNYIQHIGLSRYVGHAKKLTGVLQIGSSYEISHRSNQTQIKPIFTRLNQADFTKNLGVNR